MHNKIYIIDDRTLITGSANISNYSENFNLENIIIINNKKIIN